LWSLKLDKKNQIIYLGDYDGKFYVVDRNNLRKKNYQRFDLMEFYKGNPKIKQGFKPALWGIEIIGDEFAFGTRWGDVLFFDKKFNLNKRVNMKEDITYLKKISKNEMLVATRYGKLFILNLNTLKYKKILEIKPSLQKENAIWNIVSLKKAYLVCFADGWICKIS
jgi:hypothetical protein